LFHVSGNIKFKYKNGEKIFLNSDRAITTAKAPSVSREEPNLEVASSSGNILGLEKNTPAILYDFA
jgi:hypothetical protein